MHDISIFRVEKSRSKQVYCWYYELLESSIVVVELALQVYCNLVLKIIHCAGSGGVGLFYRKVFPHWKIFVLCVMCFFLCLFDLCLLS